ncbi:SMI1/KNR4 family protein [Archangium violaceum]
MSAQEVEVAMEELLLRVVPGLAEQWQGATPDAIARLERIAGRPLPPFYRWFLTHMGQSMGPLAYPTFDFSVQHVLDCYAQEWFEPHPRFLLIADDSKEMMPSPLFYDLDTPTRADAMVTTWEAQADEDDRYDQFETLHEMLAWSALYRFRVRKMPQTCSGTVSGDDPNLISLIEPVMRNLGFTQPISTGPYCGLYERGDAVMLCKGMPRHGFDQARSFNLGGTTPGALRKILGELATESSLKIKVAEWAPGV